MSWIGSAGKRLNRWALKSTGLNSQDEHAAAPSRYDRAGALRAQDSQIDTTGVGLSRAANFNATDAINNYARGAWGSISEALGEQLRSLSGSAVGAGRFDSGFYDEDQGVLVNNATRQFSNAVAQQSVAGAQMDAANNQFLGQANLDLVAARRGEEEERYAANQERRRRNSIGGMIGSILPAVGQGFGMSMGRRMGGG